MASLVFYMVAVLALASHGIEGNLSLSLSLSDSVFAEKYQTYIGAIRRKIMANTDDKVYGIQVLRNNVPISQRFISMNLDPGTGDLVTLAIDVKNVGLVAYCANNISYLFLDAPREALQAVFPTAASRTLLGFKSDYESMEGAAGITRMETLLGVGPLTTSISNLLNNRQQYVPESFLVITQMVLEPLKFRFIEQSILKILRTDGTFYPGLAMLSLEDNWVKLSSQIQASVSLQGLFTTTIDLFDSNDRIIRVDSIHYPIIATNIALMLHRCHPADTNTNTNTNTIIRMPGVVSDSDSCYVGMLRRTTRITGRDGLCIGAEYIRYVDGIPIILNPCGEQVNQKWTFRSDGTIRAVGKCLTFNLENYVVVISDCSKVAPSTTKWKVSFDGTITNPDSGLVLTANASTTKTKLTVEANTKAFGQGWRVGSYLKPIISSIIGLKGMCLEATNKNTNVGLENCVKNKAEQNWALYGDGTIRVNNDRNLCVSSSADGSPGLVSILSCVGSANQRWFFTVDGTILNPKTGMALAVERGDVSLKRINLQPITTGKAEQEWALFY